MIRFLCASIVAAYFLLLSDRNELNTELIVWMCKEDEDVSWYVSLKCGEILVKSVCSEHDSGWWSLVYWGHGLVKTLGLKTQGEFAIKESK